VRSEGKGKEDEMLNVPEAMSDSSGTKVYIMKFDMTVK
jgi:hypothetical protein